MPCPSDVSSAANTAGTAPPAASGAPSAAAELTTAVLGDSALSALPGDSVTFRILVDQDGGSSGASTAPTDKVDAAEPAGVPDNSPNVRVVVVSKLQVSRSHGAFSHFGHFE